MMIDDVNRHLGDLYTMFCDIQAELMLAQMQCDSYRNDFNEAMAEIKDLQEELRSSKDYIATLESKLLEVREGRK